MSIVFILPAVTDRRYRWQENIVHQVDFPDPFHIINYSLCSRLRTKVEIAAVEDGRLGCCGRQPSRLQKVNDRPEACLP